MCNPMNNPMARHRIPRESSRVESGGARNITSLVGSGRDGSGWVRRLSNLTGQGDLTLPDPTRPDPTRPDPNRPDLIQPASCDPIRENRFTFRPKSSTLSEVASHSPERQHRNNVREAHGHVDEGAEHGQEERVVVHGVRLELHEHAVARADEDHDYERHHLHWGNPETEKRATERPTS